MLIVYFNTFILSVSYDCKIYSKGREKIVYLAVHNYFFIFYDKTKFMIYLGNQINTLHVWIFIVKIFII